jgi:hypothetical protein
MYRNYNAEIPEREVKKKDKGKESKKLSYADQMKTRKLFEFDGKEGLESPKEIAKGNGEDCESGEQSSTLLQKRQKKLDAVDDIQCNNDFNDSYVCTRSEQLSFNKEKEKLREYFKKLKVGMIEWNQVPEHYQRLLERYYHIGEV